MAQLIWALQSGKQAATASAEGGSSMELVGPYGRLIALQTFTELVRSDRRYRRWRRELLARYPALALELDAEAWQPSDDLLLLRDTWQADTAVGDATFYYEFASYVMGLDKQDGARFVGEVSLKAEEFLFNLIPQGREAFLEMIITDKHPFTPQFNGEPIKYTLQFDMMPFGTEAELRRTMRRATSDFIKDLRARRGALRASERMTVEEVRNRVTWLFRNLILGDSEAKIMQVGASRESITRGIRVAKNLLGIPLRKGRPRKSSRSKR